jgi:hypothetical protein
MKYTLIAEDTWDGSKTTREFEVDALPEVLTEIELFLRGAGFFFNGNLDFVNDFEELEWHTEEWDTPQDDISEWDKVHSKYYFDTERNK